MRTFFCVGLALSGILWATSSVASPKEASVHQASGRTSSAKVEVSVGPRAPAPRKAGNADLVRKLPSQFRFLAAYLPSEPVPTPGLDAITRNQETRARASSFADISRVCPPEPMTVRAPELLVGAGTAGAAIALHPTVVDNENGTTVQINPMIWPPGILIQGVFF